MQTSDWIAVGSGVLALIAIIASLLVARSQQRLARREQLFAVTSELFTEFRTPDFKNRVTFILTKLQDDSPMAADGTLSLSENSRTQATPVMSYFSNVGLLLRYESLNAELVSSMMGGSVIRTWKVLAPYIYAERQRRSGGDDPNYYGCYEHLAATVAELGGPKRLESRLALRRLPPDAALLVQ